jgi:SAM-dependent MidA family methyltransferase
VPRQDAAAGWVRRARAALDGGSVLALDYAATTAELGRRPWRDWVRTFREHGPGTDPLEDPGSQDVTVVVCVDQLPPPDRDRSQAEFLRAHGLEDLVEEGRRTWEERAHLGDLVALEGRSRVREAEALTDPAGLGALRALEWDA